MNDILKRILLIFEFLYLLSFCCLLLLLLWMGGYFIHSFFFTYEFNFFGNHLDSLDEIIFITNFFYAPAFIFLRWLLTGNFQIVPENLRNFFKAKNIVIILIVFSVFTLGTGIKGYVDYNSAKKNTISTSTTISSLAQELYFGNTVSVIRAKKNYQGLICTEKDQIGVLRIYIYEVHNKQEMPRIQRKVAHYTEVIDTFGNRLYKIKQEDLATSDTEFKYRIEAGYEFQDLGFNTRFDIVINRNTLELVAKSYIYGRKSSYQCKKTDHEEIKDFVKNHNDSVKSKRQL